MNDKTIGADHASKREHILAAVTSIFLRHGFHGTSMRDICAAAGMSPGALYRYFPGKEDIIDAVVAQRHAAWENTFRIAVQAGGFFDALDGLTSIALDEEEVNQLPLWIEIAAEAARNERIAKARRDHYEVLTREMAEVAAKAMESGELSARTNARDVAAVVISAFDGLKLRRGSDTDFDFRRTLRCSVLMLGQALGGKATNNRIPRLPAT